MRIFVILFIAGLAAAIGQSENEESTESMKLSKRGTQLHHIAQLNAAGIPVSGCKRKGLRYVEET